MKCSTLCKPQFPLILLLNFTTLLASQIVELQFTSPKIQHEAHSFGAVRPEVASSKPLDFDHTSLPISFSKDNTQIVYRRPNSNNSNLENIDNLLQAFKQDSSKDNLIIAYEQPDYNNAVNDLRLISQKLPNEWKVNYSNYICNDRTKPGLRRYGSTCIFTMISKHEHIAITSLKYADLIHYPRILSGDDNSTNQTSQTDKNFDINLSIVRLSVPKYLVVIVVMGAVFLISIVVIMCLKLRKKKNDPRTEQRRLENQHLVPSTVSAAPMTPPLTLESPEFRTSFNRKKKSLIKQESGGVSPANGVATVQLLKLEDNQRSSMLPEDPILTNIDNSPDSVNSSKNSVRSAPKTLDFNIEFSMVEQNKRPKNKKNSTKTKS